MAKRLFDRDCHTRGHGKKSLPYIPRCSLSPASLGMMKKPGKNFCTYPVENFGSKSPKYRKNERWNTVRISDRYRKNKR
jgi:hypothetical protein